MRRRRYLTLAGFAATGTLAGCSGDSEDGNTSTDDNETDDRSADNTSNRNESQPDNENTNNNDSTDNENGNETGDQNGGDDEPESAAFEVVSLTIPETVTAGENHTVEVTVENTGSQTGTFESEVQIDDTGDGSFRTLQTVRSTDFAAGATETITTDAITIDSPTTVTVRAGDTEQSYEVTPWPASFSFVDITSPESVRAGEEHTFEITIENTGGQQDEQFVDVFLNEDFMAGDKIELDAGASATTSIAFDAPAEVGSYSVTVETADDEITLPLEVEETVADIDPQTFSGTGSEVRDSIQIDGGITVVEAHHEQASEFGSNFIVELVGDGRSGELFVNEIGTYDGTQAALVDAGEYILDVTAEGGWEIEIRQPRASSAPSPPANFEGDGPDVVGPLLFDGTGTVSGSHDGESNFIVEIVPTDGFVPTVVFNEIGSFSGETAYSVTGIGWVDVDADGEWSLTIE